MTKPNIQVGDEVREMTDAEYEQHLKDQAEYEAEFKADSERQALKTATLKKLGLTADEVAALLS